MTIKTFPAILARLRTAAELSIPELATSSGVSDDAIRSYESGKRAPMWSNVQRLAKALGVSDKHGWSRFVSLQAYYTIAGRDLERELAPLLKEEKVGLMVWSPLAGGLLSGKYSRDGSGPEGSRRVNFDFPPVDRERGFNCVDVMREIGDAHGVSVARIALAYLLHQPVVTSVIIGAKTNEQLDDNIAATTVKLSPEDLKRLNEVSALPPEYPGWMVDRQNAGRIPQS